MGKVLHGIETLCWILFVIALVLALLTAGGSAEISAVLSLPCIFFQLFKKIINDAKSK